MADEVLVEEVVLSEPHLGTDHGSSPESSAFECNICYELAQSPVVTPCGHLYCWPCLYRCAYSHVVVSVFSLPRQVAHEGDRICQEDVTSVVRLQVDAGADAVSVLPGMQGGHRAGQGGCSHSPRAT